MAHLDADDLEQAIKRANTERLDARGVTVTPLLLEQIFSLLYRTDHGAPIVPDARFDQATFSGHARFNRVRFTGAARFDQATFSRDAWFDRVRFTGAARFDQVTFSRDAGFTGAKFTGAARFTKVTFSGARGSTRSACRGGCRSGGYAPPRGCRWLSERAAWARST